MSVRLHFLRHGQTPNSRDNVFCGSGLDPELTAEGLEMAAAFGSAYADRGWNAIYSSPLQRAAATAQVIASYTRMSVVQRAELSEIAYGQWEGLDTNTVDRDFHDDYVRWTADPAWNAPTGGETAIALARRMLALVQEITAIYTDGDVLLVSHKASIRAVLCALVGVDVGRFRYRFGCPVGSVTVVEFGTHGPLAAMVADRSHLNERLRTLPGT